MEDGKSLLPSDVLQVDNIIVKSFFPEELKENGVSLAFGLMLALHGKDAYQFKFLMLCPAGEPGEAVMTEPLIYKNTRQLVMKDVCRDVQKYMGGKFRSVYVHLMEVESGEEIGISLWNINKDSRSFSIACHMEGEEAQKRLLDFVDRVYKIFLGNYEAVMNKLQLPAC